MNKNSFKYPNDHTRNVEFNSEKVYYFV